ncbi:hypothetical protein [Streptomyces agglomeratus]|uniref:hypothetical protein n=1 Tax=Streptomyces agglomeratus TaxID=285458 RepID=UPI00114CDD17|nr:hypothetical protein [Streptomyces agglomeratus]
MEPIAATIAAAAGRVLIQAMATDAWPSFRDRLVQIMSRRGREAQLTSALDEAREVVLSGSSNGEVAAIRWQGRLEQLIEEDPAAVETLRSIVESSDVGSVYLDFSAGSGNTAGSAQILQHNIGGGTILVSATATADPH